MKTQPPRRQHLLRLWREVMAQETIPQFDRWVSDAFRRNSQFGSRDRKWYAEMLFAAVRFGYLAQFCHSLPSRSVENSALLLAAIDEFQRAHPFGEGIFARWREADPEHFLGFVAERYRLAQPQEEPSGLGGGDRYRETLMALKELSLDHSRAALLFASVPLGYEPWLAQRSERSGWSAETSLSFLERQSVRPPLWVRVNHPVRRAEVISRLSSQGFLIAEQGEALRVSGASGIAATDVYREGLIEVQDLASQLAGAMVEVRPGDIVWDACAGGGGKTLQIAAALANRGAVYASDVREYKLDEVRLRARRAGFFNVRRQPWDGVELPGFQREVQKRQGFDWILVDAPCSATGTWRRNPDAKYRVTPATLGELAQLQSRILRSAARAVAPGGHLVYATCSWLVAENEGVVEGFLQDHAGFRLETMVQKGCPHLDSDTLFSARFIREQ